MHDCRLWDSVCFIIAHLILFLFYKEKYLLEEKKHLFLEKKNTDI